MSVTKNECVIFPVQQIISTSIGAICTALLMVEKISLTKINISLVVLSRRRLMLLEYVYNLNNIN